MGWGEMLALHCASNPSVLILMLVSAPDFSSEIQAGKPFLLKENTEQQTATQPNAETTTALRRTLSRVDRLQCPSILWVATWQR
jgi:hypothetical protein